MMKKRLPMPDELTPEQRAAFTELRHELLNKYGPIGALMIQGRISVRFPRLSRNA